MAETIDQPPILHPNDQDISDNESVGSMEHDNSEQFSRIESELKDEMGNIARQVKESILSMNEQIQQKFTLIDGQIQSIQAQIRDQNNNQGITQLRNSTPVQNVPLTQSNGCVGNTLLGQPSQQGISFNLHGTNSQTTASSSISQSRINNSMKLKPQTYSGKDDFEDFLTQFEITSEINNWDYKAKSLYLANCLTESARTLLNELTAEQRRDYASLVQKLTERYGSENRAEVFRSQLKSRVKGKGETIQQLAMSIRKLTRQSYPNASQDVIEALSLDHFIDALTETEIRLRLREVSPKTLSEAEKIAVRMEAHRIADKQRLRLVGKVEQNAPPHEQNNQMSLSSPSQSSLEKCLENLTKNVDSIQKSLQGIQRQNMQGNNNSNYARSNPPPNRPYNNRNFNNNRQFQPRGGNQRPNQPQQNYPPAQPPRYQNNRPGNFNQPNQGSGYRLN